MHDLLHQLSAINTQNSTPWLIILTPPWQHLCKYLLLHCKRRAAPTKMFQPRKSAPVFWTSCVVVVRAKVRFSFDSGFISLCFFGCWFRDLFRSNDFVLKWLIDELFACKIWKNYRGTIIVAKCTMSISTGFELFYSNTSFCCVAKCQIHSMIWLRKIWLRKEKIIVYVDIKIRVVAVLLQLS